MYRKLSPILVAVVTIALGLALTEAPLAQQPNFSGALWGDGELWGTKVVTTLPAPNPRARNERSFDKFFVIVNSNNPSVQLNVSEAAPGNPYYNGGRWFTHTVTWTQLGFDELGTVPILTSYEEIAMYESMGYLTVMAGSPMGGPPLYFVCPLLPVK